MPTFDPDSVERGDDRDVEEIKPAQVVVAQPATPMVANFDGMKQRRDALVRCMREVMQEGTDKHFAKIPGCGDKPALLKSGAEVLAQTFSLAPRLTIERTDLPGGHREYQVTCELLHIPTGAFVGQGIGICSTMERKYRWRRGERTCPSCCVIGSVIAGKKEYGGGWLCWAKKQGCGAKFASGDKAITEQQVGDVENPDIADTYNTVLKMGKKRALVDAILTATGASDLLTQDIEEGYDPSQHEEPAAAPPPRQQGQGRRPAPPPPADDASEYGTPPEPARKAPPKGRRPKAEPKARVGVERPEPTAEELASLGVDADAWFREMVSCGTVEDLERTLAEMKEAKGSLAAHEVAVLRKAAAHLLDTFNPVMEKA